MPLLQRMLLPLAVWLALSAAALAQPGLPSEWEHGTTVTGFAGVAADSAATGPVVGGAVGWEVTPRLAVEGTGAWLEFGSGASSFAGDLTLRARLSGRRAFDPFIQAGVGMYRATYDVRHAGAMPAFYQRRMAALPDTMVLRTFTDPTLVVGGGASVFLTRSFAVRPDVDAIVVFREGRRHLVTRAAVHAVFTFEERPVTPARGR